MQRMPCKAKITQVNESKIPSLGMDVAELVPSGERASEAGCVTGGRLGSRKGGTSNKKKGQEPGKEWWDVQIPWWVLSGGHASQPHVCWWWLEQDSCPDLPPDHAMRVGLRPQPGCRDASSWVLYLTGKGTDRHGQTDRACCYHHASAHFRSDGTGNYPQLRNKNYYVGKINILDRPI